MTDATVDGLIAGRFRLGDLLGTGGSASVFSAVEVATGVPVALKILHPHLSESVQSRASFFAEARAAAAVQHRNVIAVLGVGGDSAAGEDVDVPQAWIALALVPGMSLAELVERTGALPVSAALAVARGVLQALVAAHSVGLVHRDVSPANIMVVPEADGSLSADRVVLLDFGLANAAGHTALAGGAAVAYAAVSGIAKEQPLGVLGTVNYLSPEQARGMAVDERGDVYQMGGVLYFALTGHPPFSRPSVAAVLRAHAQAPPPVPSVVRSGVSRTLDGIVVKALLKDRTSRFQSAADMLSAIALLSAPIDCNPNGRTRILNRPGYENGDRNTVVLVRQTPVTAAADRDIAPGTGALARRGRRRPGFAGWLAFLLVASSVAGGWALAAQGQGQPPNPVSSTPAVSSGAEQPAEQPVEEPVEHAVAPVAALVPSAQSAALVPIPQLVALTLDAARAALETAGLRVGTLTIENSPNPGNTVLALSPAAGTRVDSGGVVDLTVASGANLVPSIRARSRDEAVRVLEDAGFTTQPDSRAHETLPAGTVVASEPGTGIVLRLGAAVTVVVSTGPAQVHTAVPTPIPTQTQTQTPSPAATRPPA